MKSIQMQVTIDLSAAFAGQLQAKADGLGLSVAELVKKILVKEVKKEKYPTYKASKSTIQAAKQAMKDYKAGKATVVHDVHEFFKNL